MKPDCISLRVFGVGGSIGWVTGYDGDEYLLDYDGTNVSSAGGLSMVALQGFAMRYVLCMRVREGAAR